MNEQTLEQLLEEAQRVPPEAPWSDLPPSVFSAAVFLAQVSRFMLTSAPRPLWSICVEAANGDNPMWEKTREGWKDAYSLITRLATSTNMLPWSLHHEDGETVEPADLEPAETALELARSALVEMVTSILSDDAKEGTGFLLSGVSKTTTYAQEAAILFRAALGQDQDEEEDDEPVDRHEELRKQIDAVRAGHGLGFTMTTSLNIVEALRDVAPTLTGPDVIKMEAIQDRGSASVTLTPMATGVQAATDPVTIPRAKITVKKHVEVRGFMRGDGRQIMAEFGDVVFGVDLGEPIDDEHQALQLELVAALNERNEQAGLTRCVVCGKPFVRTRRAGLYCSNKCGNRARNRRLSERRRSQSEASDSSIRPIDGFARDSH